MQRHAKMEFNEGMEELVDITNRPSKKEPQASRSPIVLKVTIGSWLPLLFCLVFILTLEKSGTRPPWNTPRVTMEEAKGISHHSEVGTNHENKSSNPISQVGNSGSSSSGWQQNVVYGHVHIAKTAGTSLNGELAMKYERVCGHKGYSFDAWNANIRNAGRLEYNATDVYGKLYHTYNRGRVPFQIMKEIGFQDCDYVSLEESWYEWRTIFHNFPIPLELHVPCRDPINLLLSGCNNNEIEFDCNITGAMIPQMVSKCLVHPHRFSMTLAQQFPVKCFNSSHLTQYIEYMSNRLQPKRIPGKYIPRPSNRHRNKDAECLLKDDALQQQVLAYLMQLPYYQFCSQCIGSKNDLLLQE